MTLFPLEVFKMPSPTLRKAAASVLLAYAVLCLAFPFYTHSAKLMSGLILREEFGPRFFAMAPVEFADGSLRVLTEQHFDRWQMNWSRTIHGYLLISSVSLAVVWIGAAFVGRKNTGIYLITE